MVAFTPQAKPGITSPKLLETPRFFVPLPPRKAPPAAVIEEEPKARWWPGEEPKGDIDKAK